MNWAGASVFIGLITLGFMTLPYGLIVLAFLAWVIYTS